MSLESEKYGRPSAIRFKPEEEAIIERVIKERQISKSEFLRNGALCSIYLPEVIAILSTTVKTLESMLTRSDFVERGESPKRFVIRGLTESNKLERRVR